MSQISYRPDLDGLRGIAIAMAVIYHTSLGILPSGFVGIEIFFVLSGFLITSQLSRDILDNTFSIKAFYLRRFRRLLPAYFFITMAVFIVASFILLPDDYSYHVKLMGLGFLSVGNFYLANTTDGYFAKEIDEIPFVHTWSLSVEEQFYLLWPILLLFVLKRFSYKTSVRIFGLLLVSALLYSEWMVNDNPVSAYFLLPSRFYELLLGSILGLMVGYLPALKNWQAALLSLAGLLVITVNAFSHTASQHFPGFNALYTCMATVFIIYAGGTKNRVNDFISARPLTGLGKISYSLYLWHWPIFVFIRYITGGITPVQSVIAIVVSLALSFLTWKFIENPFRIKWKFSFRKTFIVMYIIPAILFIVINMVVDKMDGIPERFGRHKDAVIAMDSKPELHNEDCPAQSVKPCHIAALIGDSHAEHFSPFVHGLIGDNPSLKLQSQSIGFCLPVTGMYRVLMDEQKGKRTIYREDNPCYQKTEAFYSSLTPDKYRYVILASYWSMLDIKKDNVFFFDKNNEEFSYETSQEVFREALYRTLRIIIEKNITPVIINDNLSISEEQLKCARKKLLIASFHDSCEVDYEMLVSQQERVNTLFTDIARDFPRVRFIDVNDVLCADKKHCQTTLDGMPIYRDVQHLTGYGSQLLAKKYRLLHPQPLE